MTVKLTYFKHSGKYYSEGEFQVPKDTDLNAIFSTVRSLARHAHLPGLVDGANEFHVLIDVPEHPHNHPHLVLDYGNGVHNEW